MPGLRANLDEAHHDPPSINGEARSVARCEWALLLSDRLRVRMGGSARTNHLPKYAKPLHLHRRVGRALFPAKDLAATVSASRVGESYPLGLEELLVRSKQVWHTVCSTASSPQRSRTARPWRQPNSQRSCATPRSVGSCSLRTANPWTRHGRRGPSRPRKPKQSWHATEPVATPTATEEVKSAKSTTLRNGSGTGPQW